MVKNTCLQILSGNESPTCSIQAPLEEEPGRLSFPTSRKHLSGCFALKQLPVLIGSDKKPYIN